MRDLNFEVATDGWGTVHFKCLFLHLLMLSIVFHTFLKLIASNKKYTLENESIYPFHKFEENPPIFAKRSWSFFILFIFQSNFHLLDILFANSSCCEWRPCAIKFGADCNEARGKCPL
jgi:hypothetical protein